jgi:hypothetical protein
MKKSSNGEATPTSEVVFRLVGSIITLHEHARTPDRSGLLIAVCLRVEE